MRRNAFIGFLLVFAFLSGQAWAQLPDKIVWQKCLGGTADEFAYSVVKTTDGGIVVAGYTDSQNGDVVGNHGGEDGWVVKLNSAGVIQWAKCLGGTASDYLYSIIQTSDSGYAVAGQTLSSDGDVSGNHGGGDAWVVKLNDTGGIEWQHCYGGSSSEIFSSISQTSDGGYVMGGQTMSTDGDVSGFHGGVFSDAWVVKINGTGAIQWQKCLGGNEDDVSSAVIQTAGGEFIMAGTTGSVNNGDVHGFLGGSSDAWVVMLSDSVIQWQECLGGTGEDAANSIIQTTDGGFVLAAYTTSDDDDVSGLHGVYYGDAWIVKLNGVGDIQWQKCYGGTEDDDARSIVQTNDNGFVFAGTTVSNDGDVSGYFGGVDEWVVKLTDSGKIQWQKCLGGTNVDIANSIIQTSSSNYVVAGYTGSNDSDVSGNHGSGLDEWVVTLGDPPAPVINYITPDAGAPGMCVAVEIIGPTNHPGNFGNGDDQPWYPNTIVALSRPSDSLLVKLGPAFTSWNGRMIQQMFMIEPHAAQIDTEIYFQAYLNGVPSAVDSFRIVTPTHFVPPVGGGTLPTTGRTKGNTMVVDSMILANGTFTCPQTDPDPNTPGNQSYLPLRILSMGPIELSGATLSANGYSWT